MMDFLQFFDPHVKDLRKSGKNHKGWCPFHADDGSKRKGFSLDPTTGLWKCFGCGKKGNVFSFYKILGKSIPDEAKLAASPPIWESFQNRKRKTSSSLETWEPNDPTPPNGEWYKRAKRIIRNSLILLHHSGKCEEIRKWVNIERGINKKGFERLGYILSNIFYAPESWGLSRKMDVCVPAGLLIPITQTLPDGRDVILGIKTREPDGEYRLLHGSCDVPLILGNDKSFTMVLESELDALLLWEIAGDLVNVVGLGGATKRPDKTTTNLLRSCEKVLISLDSDSEGKKQSLWWMTHFDNGHLWPLPSSWGKDPGEAWKNGLRLELRDWVRAALIDDKAGTDDSRPCEAKETRTIITPAESKPEPRRESKPKPRQETPTHKCPICRSNKWFRRKDGLGGWTCGMCHPPVISASEMLLAGDGWDD